MTRVFAISEGITHLEDLELEKFLSVIDNLTKLQASEKLDGSELVFGLDGEGKFYTTRNAKGGTGVNYRTDQYLKGGGGPTFAAAHEALHKVIAIIKSVMKPNEAVEVEVIYGRQPNAIVYGLDGLNYIAFLRAVEGTNGDVELRKDLPGKLSHALKTQRITIASTFPGSDDGETIKDEKVMSTWKFTDTPNVDVQNIKHDAKAEIDNLRKFLEKSNAVATDSGVELNNFEVATLNLTSIPIDKRPAIKKERDVVNSKIMAEFKLPIKEKLLHSFTKKVKSKLQGDVNKDELGGIEGVVFVDPVSNEVFKLVDKDAFSSVNQFNYQIRKKLFSVVRTIDQDATLEARGGIVGVLKFRIMSLLGIPEATRGFSLKKMLSAFDGESAEDTVAKFATGFKSINDMAYRHKISAMIDATIDELATTLKSFKKEYTTYKLKLKDGSEIGYTQEIVRRTLLTFAEVKAYLVKFKKKIDESAGVEGLIKAVIGDAADKVHNADTLTEGARLRNAEAATASIKRLKKFRDASLSEMLHVYTYNYLAALILCRAKDKFGMHELRDIKGASLRKLSNASSYINQLGCLIHHSTENGEYLKTVTRNQLKLLSNKITAERKKKIHSLLSSSHNYRLDYTHVEINLHVLNTRFELNDKFLLAAAHTLKNWTDASLDAKNKLMYKTFTKLQSIDFESPYVDILRHTIETFMKHPKANLKENSMLIQEIMHLVEDGEGGEGGEGAPQLATTSASIASLPTRLFKGKVIRRIPRKIEKRKKFMKNKQDIAAKQ